MALRVGFAEQDITPPLGLPLGGYAARVATAGGVLDPLCCRTVMIDDGTAPLAIIALDLVYVFGEWVARLRTRVTHALGLPAERILVAATHTHAGPGVFRSALHTHERLCAYERDLVEVVVTCVTAARDAAVPAELQLGSAVVPGVAGNRRDPVSTVDQRVRTVSATSRRGQLIGVLANFACHPTVLCAANAAYSADLFGAAARAAAHALGGPVVLTNGAAGDVSTRFTRRAQDAAEVRRLGRALGESIGAAVRAACPVGAVPLGAAQHRLPLRARPLPRPAEAKARLERALAALQEQEGRGADTPTLRSAQARLEGAQAELWMSTRGGWEVLFGPRTPSAMVHALRCGDVSIVAAPGELFSSAAGWLRSRLGDDALVIGYANDYLGYFVPPDEAATGGYEALIAMVDPACEATVRHGLLEAAAAAGCRVHPDRPA